MPTPFMLPSGADHGLPDATSKSLGSLLEDTGILSKLFGLFAPIEPSRLAAFPYIDHSPPTSVLAASTHTSHARITMTSNNTVLSFTSKLYSKTLISTSISRSDFNKDDPSNPWQTSPISLLINVPLKFKALPGANHTAHLQETLGCRVVNNTAQLLSINCDMTSPDFGTYAIEPITEDILIVRQDGQDLDVRELTDVLYFLRCAVDMARDMFVRVLQGIERYEAVERRCKWYFSRKGASDAWEYMAQRERGERVGRRNPFL